MRLVLGYSFHLSSYNVVLIYLIHCSEEEPEAETSDSDDQSLGDDDRKGAISDKISDEGIATEADDGRDSGREYYSKEYIA